MVLAMRGQVNTKEVSPLHSEQEIFVEEEVLKISDSDTATKYIP